MVLATAACLGSVAFSITCQTPAVLIAFCVFGVIGLVVATRWGPSESRTFTIIYCSNVLFVIALYLIYLQRYGSPYFIGGSDDFSFELVAKEIVARLGAFEYSQIRGNIVPASYNSVGYVYLLSLLYRISELLGGFHTLVPRLLNSLVLSLLGVLVLRFARNRLQLKESISFKVGLAVGLMPIMMFISAHTFRDIIVGFLLFMLVYTWSSYALGGVIFRLALFLWTPLCILALWEFRSFSAIVGCSLVLISFYESLRWRNKGKKNMALFSWVAFGTLVTLVLLISSNHWEWFMRRAATVYRGYTSYRIGLSPGLSTFVFASPEPLSFVLRVIYASVVPFPILTVQVERLWISLGTLVQVFFLPFVGVGVWKLAREKRVLGIWVGFLGLFIGEVLLSFSVRHVAMYFPFGALIAGYGYECYRKKQHDLLNLPALVYGGFAAGLMLYTVIKLLS